MQRRKTNGKRVSKFVQRVDTSLIYAKEVLSMLAVTTPIVMNNSGKSGYAEGRKDDLRLLRRLLKEHKEYKLYNGWIKIDGIVINGISKKEIEEIEKEIN